MLDSHVSAYAQSLATIVAAVIVVVGTPIIGAWAYFRQKEYDTVRQRYLDDGVVGIIRKVEEALNVFEYNWAHSIHLLRTYRDLGPNTPPELYKSGFLASDRLLSLEASRHYLLTDIVGDKIYFDVHQLLTAFLHETQNLFVVDLCSAIRVSIEGGKEGTQIASPEKIFEAYKEELAKVHEGVESYYIYLGYLQVLASLLSKKTYSFKKLDRFREDPRVQESISVLKERFKEQLSKYSNSRVA